MQHVIARAQGARRPRREPRGADLRPAAARPRRLARRAGADGRAGLHLARRLPRRRLRDEGAGRGGATSCSSSSPPRTPTSSGRLAEFESEHAHRHPRGHRGALGGEFAFALDGPVLPKPSWKLVVEVYDPARLQATLEWAVGRLNRAARRTRAARGSASSTSRRAAAGPSTSSSRSTRALGALHVRRRLPGGRASRGAARARAADPRRRRHADPLPAIHRAAAAGRRRSTSPRCVYQNLGPVLGPLAQLGDGAAPSSSAEMRAAARRPGLA